MIEVDLERRLIRGEMRQVDLIPTYRTFTFLRRFRREDNVVAVCLSLLMTLGFYTMYGFTRLVSTFVDAEDLLAGLVT